jgi:hypothetical protein
MRRAKGNEEFVKWWERWTSEIQRTRASTQLSQPAKDGQVDKRAYTPRPLGGNIKRRTVRPCDKAS